MTFKETDFPDILEQIEKICESEKNPAAAVEIIRQVVKIYKQIPIYPGLVELVSNAIEEEVEPGELESGDFVTLSDGGAFYFGKIESIEDNEVQLNDVVQTESRGTMKIELNKFSDCRRVNRDALQQEWPELYFEDDN